ncbi:MAG: AraC family transcriptional regulator [Cytophagia bacterium]|nr:MAG: AraC family transcriptional regulator [Cytophagia bacterium]TAG38212.1 MAG: AraC family transcriptional regulator [Cytophagia bacterium]TAH29780.1 MAG: AraC family transcriptional regulator [Cytophagales bacterium]
MEEYNQIIESINVKFLKAKNIKILQSIQVKNYYNVENFLFLLHHSELSFGDGTKKVEKGDLLFVPGSRPASVWFGNVSQARLIKNEEFISHRERYFDTNTDINLVGKLENSCSYLAFESKVFDSINFFSSLDIPPFIIREQPALARLVKEIIIENMSNTPGKERIIELKTEQIVIEIIRYLLKEGMFVEKLATNNTYFKDARLIDIFNHIKSDLSGDLSNKILATIAGISEEYVGQYFKQLTGINPQDYIEYQRMEKSVVLLRTSKKSVKDISAEVGYKDTAYFCRRFKMMFGIPAGKMRRRDITSL